MKKEDRLHILDTVINMREEWSRARLSLLQCHLEHAIDETTELGGLHEEKDMKEAGQMLRELLIFLEKLLPQKTTKMNVHGLDDDIAA